MKNMKITFISLCSLIIILSTMIAVTFCSSESTTSTEPSYSTPNDISEEVSSTESAEEFLESETSEPVVESPDASIYEESLPETSEPMIEESDISDSETSEEPIIAVEPLGEFIITYYCSCEKCCGKWAVDRPVVSGKKIVFTASGAIAQAGITIAVDPSVVPFGTLLYIEGIGYRIAQDTGSSIKGNKIDIYVNKHADIPVKGRHPAQVYKLNNIS